MKNTNSTQLTCSYGNGNNRADLFINDNGDGSHWYAASGSHNINKTFNPIVEGVNIEELMDVDTFSVSDAPETLEAFEMIISQYING